MIWAECFFCISCLKFRRILFVRENHGRCITLCVRSPVPFVNRSLHDWNKLFELLCSIVFRDATNFTLQVDYGVFSVEGSSWFHHFQYKVFLLSEVITCFPAVWYCAGNDQVVCEESVMMKKCRMTFEYIV